jgi:hypothetical protein
VQQASSYEQYPSPESLRPEVKIAHERVAEAEAGVANLEAHRPTPVEETPQQMPEENFWELAA